MKPIVRAIALIALAMLLCACMNLAAPLVDTKAMRDHAWQGALMLGEQESTPQLVGGFKSAQLDNYTGVLILKTAAYVGQEPWLQRAFGGLRVDMPAAEGESAWQAYCNYEFGESAPDGSLIHYARYWHGYMLPLRLLLCVFDLANLQMLLYFAQAALFAAVLVSLHRRGLRALIPGFFLSFFLMMPAATGVCIQYAPVSFLTLTACLLILRGSEKIRCAITLPGFFALAGLLTNYFDLLTAPLVTLLFPLVLLECLHIKKGDSLRELALLMIACCAAWAAGYGFMWMSKWLLNCLVYGLGHLGNIFRQAALRTSTAAAYTRLDVVLRNLNVILGKKSYLILIAATGLATIAPSARALISRRGVTLNPRACILLLPMLLPIAWYIVLANHSYDHTYFTYRTAVPAVLSAFAFAALILTPRDKENAS